MKLSRLKLLKALVKGEAPVVSVCVWEKDKARAPVYAVREYGLREGMWVMTLEGIGVLTKILGSGEVEVALTDDHKGEKIGDVRVHKDSVRQSPWLQIPKLRRPDKLQADLLGYL